jgi:hypothetical protein
MDLFKRAHTWFAWWAAFDALCLEHPATTEAAVAARDELRRFPMTYRTLYQEEKDYREVVDETQLPVEQLLAIHDLLFGE